MAIPAESEEIEAVGHDTESRLAGDFAGHVFQAAQIRIDDLLAASANDMRVRVGLVAVVAVAAVRETDLQQLTDLLEKADRLVDGGDTGRGEIPTNRLVDLVDGGMADARGQHLDHGQPLGCDPELAPPQFGEHLIEALAGSRGCCAFFHHCC